MKIKYHSRVDAVNKISGKADGAGQKHAVFVSRWNDFITERLQDGAISALERHGVRDSDITVVYVPGAFELASAAKLAAESKKYDAVICLGAVIRGATPHFDYVAGQAARLIAQISYDTGIPAVFGVLTTDTIEQAIERAGTKAGNKGVEAALTAIELVNLYKELKGKV